MTVDCGGTFNFTLYSVYSQYSSAYYMCTQCVSRLTYSTMTSLRSVCGRLPRRCHLVQLHAPVPCSVLHVPVRCYRASATAVASLLSAEPCWRRLLCTVRRISRNIYQPER